MPFISKLAQLKTHVSTQTKQLKLMSHAQNQETLPGTPILLQEQVSQLMLKLHHTQDMPFISKLAQLLTNALTQTKQLKLMNHALNQETQPGTLILLLELVNQLMLKHHHTQDMLFIFRLTHLLTHASTQIKQLKLMRHALNQETQPGTLIPHQELESQLMLKLHHTQDMLFIFRLTHLIIIALTQTKQPRLMKHAPNQETLLGTPIPHLELESQLMLNHHHIQTTPFTEEVFDQK